MRLFYILYQNYNNTLLGEGVVAELEGGELLHSLESGGVRSGRLWATPGGSRLVKVPSS